MDPYYSGEELLVKTRKPYTITKQRERWTVEEHNKFLDALKLYGRSWQLIEEHIGTKTAVQIRSHAQKFFTKLEKESFVKGVPIGHTLNINIPPPRPKRKPSNPYPRKPSAGVKNGKPSAPLSFLCQGQTKLDLEQEPLSEKSSDDGNNRQRDDRNLENDSAVFSIHETGACANSFLVKKNSPALVAPTNLYTFREYVPLSTEKSNQDETTRADAKQLQTNQTCNKQLLQGDASYNTSNFGNSYLSHEKCRQGKRIDELKQPKNIGNFPTTNDDVSQNCLPHIPVDILEGSFTMNTQSVVLDTAHTDSGYEKMGVLGSPCLFMNPCGSTTPEHHSNAASSSIHQSFPGFHPLSTAFQHRDDYQSFLHLSSTFSSLLVSALLQNPAAYAAASFAATLWPGVTLDAPEESSAGTSRGLKPMQMNTVPSMATIAAATVAAATAWWAAHGLLPLCPPLHPGFNSTAPSTSATPVDVNMRSANGDEKEDIPDLALEDQQPELQEQHSSLCTSCSEGNEGGKPSSGPVVAETAQMADTVEPPDSNKSKSRKQVDRSSCGSNTPSSSEVEAGGQEEKDVEDKELKEDEENHPSSDPITRRCRSLCSINDPWKEVSEEGRLAFQALFSREILPQSFPHDLNFKRKKISDMENVKGWPLFNLNDHNRLADKEEESTTEACRTGFKPYKRCSVEAKDTRMSTSCKDEEKGPKRFRVGGIDKDST